ncbi:heme oxygenase (biliverdin-producing) [Aeromicrobium sp. UC242_57]|uniref:heme oxygenase (biliverdin-producing) n=1 Tax=Aeromicrobium sp. UC242_57 TaxID=3374624 RepID=UPI0037B3EDA9
MTITHSPTELSPAELSLSALLRTGSQSEHTQAENVGFMTELMQGRVNEAGYAQYLASLRPVYAAIEGLSQQMAGDEVASSLVDPALARLAALDADIAHWTNGAGLTVQTPAIDAYVARVEASAEWGGLYAAHHYTRYLGDLSGGLAIGRILSRHFDLEDGAGLAFYDFPEIPKPKLYKDDYRAKLDALPVDEDGALRMVTEVKAIFGLNTAIFGELTEQLDTFAR